MTQCEYPGCDKKADRLVFSRELLKVVKACYPHARVIVDERNPEFIETCPHCGCLIPVN